MTTTLYVNINSVNQSAYAKRIEITRKSMAGIGTWVAIIDNVGNQYGGTLTPENIVELKINAVSLLKGYLDDVQPYVDDEKAVYYNLLKAVGRDYGQDLANLYLTAEYYNDEGDDIADNALGSGQTEWVALTAYALGDFVEPVTDNGWSYLCVDAGTSGAGEPTWPTTPNDKVTDATVIWECRPRSEITFTSPHYLSAINASFKRDFLIDKFRDIAKVTGADFYVHDDKILHFFNLDTYPEMSDVLLWSKSSDATNNILLPIEVGEKVGFDIRNYIEVYAGDVKDHWTEGNAGDYTATDCTLSNETTIFRDGIASIKAIAGAGATARFALVFPKYHHDFLDYSKPTTGSLLLRFSIIEQPYIYLEDGSDPVNIIYYAGEYTVAGKWQEITFPIGEGTPTILSAPPWTAGNWYEGGAGMDDFDWGNIKKIGLDIPGLSENDIAYLDGLSLPGTEAKSIASDATSDTSYHTRMIPLSRSDIKSQLQLAVVSADELAKRKEPLQKLKLTCIGNTDLHYAGQIVGVLAPDSGIGLADQTTTEIGAVDKTDFRDDSITEAEHVWNYSYVRITSGLCAGEERWITHWDGDKIFTVNAAFSYGIASGVTYNLYTGYRILSLHHIAEPHVDLLMGHDYITELELIKHIASPGPQPTDYLRTRLNDNPDFVRFQRLEARVRALEKS